MARHTEQQHQRAYSASGRFVNALQNHDSILTPGRPIWTEETLSDFSRRFLGNPLTGKRSFLEKFKIQLTGAPAHTIQLAAELFYTHLIASAAMKGDTKRNRIREVLTWSPEPLMEIDEAAMADLDGELVMDQALSMRPPDCIAYLTHFAVAWQQRLSIDRDKLLADPWAFKQFVFSLEAPLAQSQREILLNMVHPETFEKMSSVTFKKRIAEHFDPSGVEPDIDRRLLRLRDQLTPKFGEDFDYWVEPVFSTWFKKAGTGGPWEELQSLTGWDALVGWVRLAFLSKQFEPSERMYKLEIAERLREARAAVRAGHSDWPTLTRKALRRENNLINFRVLSDFIGWIDVYPAESLAALQEIWREGASYRDRAQRFVATVPRDILKDRGRALQIVSVLLMADGEQYPPVKVAVFKNAFALVGYAAAPSDAIAFYEHSLQYLDELLTRARKADAQLRDRLDAQSALWMILHWMKKPDDWSDEQWEALVAFREGEGPTAPEIVPPSEEQPPPPSPSKGLEAAADELLLPMSFLEDVRTLLNEKRQVIFYGPPGTGKTFVAIKLAEALTQDDDDVLLVQFHPSYAYEDFVEGYRPRKVDGQPGFQLVDGPLKQIAERARKDPKGRYILVIDEINRGNLARVFGELFFLLEYRGRSVALQYSPEQDFSLPENLWVIGTMNTADRSIALIDAALRRRFAFVPFFPNQDPVKGLLARWFDNNRGPAELAWIAAVLDLVNERLEAMPDVGRHLQVGPSHFMNKDLTQASIERIWKYSILPYLEEQFFGREGALADFDLKALHEQAIQRASGTP